MTDEQQFFAWLDGELEGEAAAIVAARVATDPALTEQARVHRRMERVLRGAFDPLMAAPVPDRIAAPPIEFAAAREPRVMRNFGVPQWAAMAATLALGIGLGSVVGDRGGQGPVAVDKGRMVAAAALDEALDTQLASVASDGTPRIGVTFRDQKGALCRSFTSEGATGLACRDSEQWRIEGLYGSGRALGDYRMAAGTDPRLAALIDDRIAGEPFDAAAERAAQADGWR